MNIPLIADFHSLKEKVFKKPPDITLKASVDAARLEWQQSLRELDLVDRDMVDYVIYKINAAERRYMHLLDQLKKENTAAW